MLNVHRAAAGRRARKIIELSTENIVYGTIKSEIHAKLKTIYTILMQNLISV